MVNFIQLIPFLKQSLKYQQGQFWKCHQSCLPTHAILFLGLLTFTSACRLTASSEPSLKIGSLLPLTGEISAYGIPMQDSANLLIKTMNACGGVLGKPVTLISVDDQSEPQVGAEAMSKLAEVDRVAGVIGGAGSATSAAAVGIAVRNHVIMISPSSTSPMFTDRAKQGEFNGFWWRTAPPDTFQGRVIAKLAKQKSYRRIAILAVNNDYGRGLIDSFVSTFEAQGGHITNKDKLALYAPNASTFNSEILNAFQGDPDAVLLIDYSQTGSLVLRAIYQQGFLTKTPLILSDGLKDTHLAQLVGSAADGKPILAKAKSLVGTAPSVRGPAFSAFRSLYQATYQREPSIYDPNTWDTAAVLVLAAEAAKSTDANAIKEKIHEIANPPGGKVSDVCQAVDQIRQGKKINYEGAGSNVDFDAQGDVRGNYDVWTIAPNGQLRVTNTISDDMP